MAHGARPGESRCGFWGFLVESSFNVRFVPLSCIFPEPRRGLANNSLDGNAGANSSRVMIASKVDTVRDTQFMRISLCRLNRSVLNLVLGAPFMSIQRQNGQKSHAQSHALRSWVYARVLCTMLKRSTPFSSLCRPLLLYSRGGLRWGLKGTS